MIGTVLRIRYELTGLVNEGPIFATYFARDRVQGREVSVRLLRPPLDREPAFADALARAVEKSSGVRAPGIEPIFEVDEDEGRIFLVGDATRGVTLAERIRKLAPFSVPVSIGTIISLCEALEALHQAGLIHGDVSANNVIALPDGQVRLQYAGIWEAYSASATAGALVLPGMAAYLAPEVSSGAMPTAASDVYSAGVLLFELITGRLPFNADSPVAMAIKHATSATPSVRMHNSSVPSVLDEIVRKAMAKDPSARYKTAGGLLSDLRLLQDALRFGRSLTWPLQTDRAPIKEQQPAQTMVAPRMSAVRETAPERTKRSRDRDGDVPVWMTALIAALGGAVLIMTAMWLLFNMNRPKTVQVPNLKGLSETEARQTLKDLKLVMRIGARVSSETIPVDSVIDSEPAASDDVLQGARVTVKLSKGSINVTVPSVLGVTVPTAQSMLEAVGLRLDDNIAKQRSDKPEGTIIAQNPPDQKKFAQGTKIKVTVSAGNNGDVGANDPNSQIRRRYTVNVVVKDITEPVQVRIDVTDATGTNTVYADQTHNPGDSFPFSFFAYGKEITIRILYNGTVVREITQRADADGAKPADGDQENRDRGDRGGQGDNQL